MSRPFWCGRMSKSDGKRPSYDHLKFAQKWRPRPFWANNWSFWPNFVRHGLQICFARYLHWYRWANQIKKESDLYLPFYSIKTSKKCTKTAISRFAFFSQVSLIQRLITPAMINIFSVIFLRLQKEIPEIQLGADFRVRPSKIFGQIFEQQWARAHGPKTSPKMLVHVLVITSNS